MTDNEATGGAGSFRFGVVAPLRTDLPAWRDQVRRIADSGFSTLLMPTFSSGSQRPVPRWLSRRLSPTYGWVRGCTPLAAHALEYGVGSALTVGAY